MAARLNYTRNTLYFILHLLSMAGLVAASAYISGLYISVVVGVSVIWYTVKQVRNHTSFVRTQMARHPEAHEHSPNLNRIVGEVCTAARIDPATVPIYDFRTILPYEELSKEDKAIAGSYFFMGRTHNAATADAAGDVLMVSVPLLKLLSDAEEKAVFAHEVAHMGLRHNLMSIILLTMRRFTTWAPTMMIYAVTLKAGWLGGACGWAAVFLSWFAVEKLHPGGKKFMSQTNSGLTVDEIFQKTRANRIFLFLVYFACVPIFACFAPSIIPIVAGCWTLTVAGSMLYSFASRRREYEADAGGVKLGADPIAMVTALRKMELLQGRASTAFWGAESTNPKAMSLPSRFVLWYRGLFASHPQHDKRLAPLAALARKRGLKEDFIQRALTGEIHLPRDHDIPVDVIRYYARAL